MVFPHSLFPSCCIVCYQPSFFLCPWFLLLKIFQDCQISFFCKWGKNNNNVKANTIIFSRILNLPWWICSILVCMWPDYDECGFGNPCENGACVNTAGSFNCFCSPPLVLDSTKRRCVSPNTTEGLTPTNVQYFFLPWFSRCGMLCRSDLTFI